MIYGSIPSSGISKTKEEDWDTVLLLYFYCLCDPPLWFLVASFESTLEEHIISWKEGRLDWSGLSDVSPIKLRVFFVGVHNPVSKAKCHRSAKFTQESHGNSWNFLEILGNSWKFLEIHGNSWTSIIKFQEFPRIQRWGHTSEGEAIFLSISDHLLHLYLGDFSSFTIRIP